MVPLSLLLLGIAMALVWQGRRAGFILAIVLGAFAILGQIPAGLARLSAGFPFAAGICAFAIIVGALVVWYAWQGRRELANDLMEPGQGSRRLPQARHLTDIAASATGRPRSS